MSSGGFLHLNSISQSVSVYGCHVGNFDQTYTSCRERHVYALAVGSKNDVGDLLRMRLNYDRSVLQRGGLFRSVLQNY